MPTSATDDELMRHQQMRDLGHPVEPEPPGRPGVADETDEARREAKRRADRALGRDLYGRRRSGA